MQSKSQINKAQDGPIIIRKRERQTEERGGERERRRDPTCETKKGRERERDRERGSGRRNVSVAAIVRDSAVRCSHGWRSGVSAAETERATVEAERERKVRIFRSLPSPCFCSSSLSLSFSLLSLLFLGRSSQCSLLCYRKTPDDGGKTDLGWISVPLFPFFSSSLFFLSVRCNAVADEHGGPRGCGRAGYCCHRQPHAPRQSQSPGPTPARKRVCVSPAHTHAHTHTRTRTHMLSPSLLSYTTQS